MTSDTTSEARELFNYAVGEKRVVLDDMHWEEVIGLLDGWLGEVELRELRGFTPLQETISKRGDDPIGVSDGTVLDVLGFAGNLITLKTQSIQVNRGVIDQQLTWRRYEGNESTHDYSIANEWRDGYLASGSARILVLFRLPNHSGAIDNLAVATYNYDKVLHKRKYQIGTVLVQRVETIRLHQHFGSDASRVIQELVWELELMHSRTADELAGQLERMKEKTRKFERISRSISSLR